MFRFALLLELVSAVAGAMDLVKDTIVCKRRSSTTDRIMES